jgi:hypothetical protein
MQDLRGIYLTLARLDISQDLPVLIEHCSFVVILCPLGSCSLFIISEAVLLQLRKLYT